MPDKKSILLVDDEKEVIYALEKFFAHKGYTISVATDGSEALAKLNENPDLVVLDIKMPTVNGIDVLKEIKKNHKNTKTVILSGFADDYRDQLDELAPEVILNKPFSLDKLVETIQETIKKTKKSADKTHPAQTIDRYLIAKAKVLVYPANSLIYGNIVSHLRKIYYSGGDYNFESAYNEDELLAKINSFKPEIVLIDTMNIGPSKSLTEKILHNENAPKDIVIFGMAGDEKSQAYEMENVIEGLFDPLSTALNKNYMQKLSFALRQACLQHNLCKRQTTRWDIDYQRQRDEMTEQKRKAQQLGKRRSDFDSMPEAINSILSGFINVNQWHIYPDSDLVKDFKTDNFAKISAIVAVEEYFGINIPDEELKKIKTVKDLYKCIAKMVFGKEWHKK